MFFIGVNSCVKIMIDMNILIVKLLVSRVLCFFVKVICDWIGNFLKGFKVVLLK